MEKKFYPWGIEKFEAVNTYAPAFHQPRKLKHIDGNSRIELQWNRVPAPVKPRSVAEEMQETLDKINKLLSNLSSSRSKTHLAPALAQLPALPDMTLNSDLESLSRDITAITQDIKNGKQKPAESGKAAESVSVKSTETDSGVGMSDSIRSRAASSNTINSSLPSLRSSANSSAHNPPIEDPAPADHAPRKRSISEASSSSNFYRGSEMSQQVSLHKSSFASIAGLCGFEEPPLARGRQHSAASSVNSFQAYVRDHSKLERNPTKPGEGYYTEYPPQKGGTMFKGIFEHDISGLMDDSARGLISF